MSKFGDIGSRRKEADKDAVNRVVNGGQVEIKDRSNTDKRVPLQVMIPPAVKHEIKVSAALRGIKMHELFMEMYSFYKEHHE